MNLTSQLKSLLLIWNWFHLLLLQMFLPQQTFHQALRGNVYLSCWYSSQQYIPGRLCRQNETSCFWLPARFLRWPSIPNPVTSVAPWHPVMIKYINKYINSNTLPYLCMSLAAFWLSLAIEYIAVLYACITNSNSYHSNIGDITIYLLP